MTSTNRSAADIYAAQEARERGRKAADQEIQDAFAGRDVAREAQDQRVLDALNGRKTPAQEAADRDVSDALAGRDREADFWTKRNHEAWNGTDSFKRANDARVVQALTGNAPANADPLWMEQSEVNMAAEAYADARIKSLPGTETSGNATRESERERDRYMAKHITEHATEAGLLEATATHLTGLAAALRSRHGQKVALPESWRNTSKPELKAVSEAPLAAHPSKPTKISRIRDGRGGRLTR
ncbi:hypothetical protein F7P69_01395 [Cellulosimicrobium funkei]|nr:hypothetical protein [Cellulosimicrobium funkei]